MSKQQTQTNEEFTPITKQKLFDGVVLSKLTGTPIAEIEKDSDGYWCKVTYNDAGQTLTHESSNDYWRKSTYNDAGKLLTYEDSDSYWVKYTYNDAGQELTFEDSNGIFYQYLASDNLYSLYFEEGRYKAGCRDFSYDEAVEHWIERSTNERESVSNRAKLFLKAIEEHQQTLNQSNT